MARIPAHLIKPNTGPAGPGIPSGAMEAPLRAMGEVLEGAGDVGKAFLATAERHNDLANERDRIRLEGLMRDRYAAINEELMKEPDPGQWMRIHDAGMADLEAEIGSQKVSPMVGDQIAGRLQEFAGRTRIRVSRDALAENLRQTRAAKMHAYESALAREDFDGALETAEGAGDVFDEGTVGRMRERVAHQQQVADIEQGIALDPVGTVEELEGGKHEWITAADRKRLTAQGKAEAARQGREAVQRILASNMPTRQDLEAALKADKRVDEATAELVLNHYDATRPLSRGMKYGLADAMTTLREQYEAGELDEWTYREQWENYGTAIAAMQKRPGVERLEKLWEAADPLKIRPDDGEAQPTKGSAAALKELGRLLKEDMAAGAFGEVDEDAAPGEQRKQRNAQEERREAIEREVRQRIGPETTTGEVRDLYELYSLQAETGSLLSRTKSVRGYVEGVAVRKDGVSGTARVEMPREQAPPSQGVLPPKTPPKEPPSANPAKRFKKWLDEGELGETGEAGEKGPAGVVTLPLDFIKNTLSNITSDELVDDAQGGISVGATANELRLLHAQRRALLARNAAIRALNAANGVPTPTTKAPPVIKGGIGSAAGKVVAGADLAWLLYDTTWLFASQNSRNDAWAKQQDYSKRPLLARLIAGQGDQAGTLYAFGRAVDEWLEASINTSKNHWSHKVKSKQIKVADAWRRDVMPDKDWQTLDNKQRLTLKTAMQASPGTLVERRKWIATWMPEDKYKKLTADQKLLLIKMATEHIAE